MALQDVITGGPLLADNIRDTLAYYGGQVTHQWLTYFKWTANINEWSKCKPYLDTNTPNRTEPLATDAERAAVARNKNIPEVGGYGIEILSVYNSSVKDLYDKVVANNNMGYKYKRPRGGSPIRGLFIMGDFIGYTPLATIPVTHTFTDGQMIYSTDNKIEIKGGMLTTDSSLEGQIREEDLYPRLLDNSDQPYAPNRGMLVVYTGSDGLKHGLWATTEIPYASGGGVILMGTWASELQGKKAVAMEFFTNYPANYNSNHPSSTVEWDTAANGYWFAAIPDAIREIEFASATVIKPDTPSGKLWGQVIINSARYTDTTYTLCTGNFDFSTIGSAYAGGAVSNIKYGIYTNTACTTAIVEKTMTPFNIGAETTKRVTFSLSNNTNNQVTYFGVWANGVLQAYKSIALPLLDDEA